MRKEVEKYQIQDGGTRLKNLQEQPGKDLRKIGSYGRNWERPSFSSGLTMAAAAADGDENDC